MPDEMDMLIAPAICPVCGKKYTLLDTPEFRPGEQPKRFPRAEPITFPCCGDAQTIQPESVQFYAKKQLV